MEKAATQLLGKISDYLKENPAVWQGALAAGALGGLGGAVLTPDGDPNESRAERNKRRLKNALILGGLGASAGALLPMGMKEVVDEVQRPVTPNLDKSKAVTDLLESGAARAAYAATGAGVPLMLSNRAKRKAAEELVAKLNAAKPDLHATSATLQESFDKFVKDNPTAPLTQRLKAINTTQQKGLSGLINRLQYMGANPSQSLEEALKAGVKPNELKLNWKQAPNMSQRALKRGVKYGVPGLAGLFLPELVQGGFKLYDKAFPGDAAKAQNAAQKLAN